MSKLPKRAWRRRFTRKLARKKDIYTLTIYSQKKSLLFYSYLTYFLVFFLRAVQEARIG